MNMTDNNLKLPALVSEWLAAGDRTTEIFTDTVHVNRTQWNAELSAHGLPELTADRISRRDLFRMGEDAVSSPDAAISLLWHTVAFCQGQKMTDAKRRIAAVAADRDHLGALLMRTATTSRTDPAEAYALLKPERIGNVIARLGPTGFTWYLYFAGAGAPHHPCQPIDAKIARTLRWAGWRTVRDNSWAATEYAAYTRLVDRWRVEAGTDRNDVIVRGLFSVSPPTDWDYPWQNWDDRETWNSDDWMHGPLSESDLKQIYHWLALIADMYPMSTAAYDFSTIGEKIKNAVGGSIGSTSPRLRVVGDPYDERNSFRGRLGNRS